MPLLNYTTKIEASKTVSEIHEILSKIGANKILNEYDDNGYIMSLSFMIKMGEREIPFRLPSDWRPVLATMERQKNVPQRLLTDEQALRVAWRIILTWIKAQAAIIETKMVKTEQVFLPYATGHDGKTVYERLIEKPDRLLGPAN